MGEALLGRVGSTSPGEDPPPYGSEDDEKRASPSTPRTNGAAAKLEDRVSVDIDDSDDSVSRA